MRSRLLAVIGAVLVCTALAGCDPTIPAPGGAGASTPTPAATPAATPRVPQRDQVLEAINAERARAGLPPMVLNAGVAAVAREWAAGMARTGQLAHRPDLGGALRGRGVTGWGTAGENVGYSGHALDVFHNFMGSPSHRANILSSSFTQVGIGVTAGNGAVWVAIDFIG